jgi:transposase
VDQVARVVVVKAKECCRCHRPLTGDDPNPWRHQVFELPKVRPEATEYQFHTLGCECGAVTAAPWPEGVPRGMLGPRALAIVTGASGMYHLGKRTVVALLRDWFGLEVSVGTVVASEAVTSAAVAEPVAEAGRYVEEQPVVYADETGWRQGPRRARAWLWVAVTAVVTLFKINATRSREAARALLGNFEGILVSDRYGAYNQWVVEKRQLCWAHLARLWEAFAEVQGEVGQIGRRLQQETSQMFFWWRRVRDGTLRRVDFVEHMRWLEARVEELLEQGARCDHRKTARQCRHVLKRRAALWTFVRVADVEPSNNYAEQAARIGVIRRKVTLGTHSEAGSRFVERMLTVAATLKQQGRNVMEYLVAAIEAQLHGTPSPSLLPALPALAPGAIAAAEPAALKAVA